LKSPFLKKKPFATEEKKGSFGLEIEETKEDDELSDMS